MKHVFLLLSVAVFGIFSTGCATLLKGSHQPININSNVPGADVLINNQKVGTTPFTGTIKRQKAVQLTVKKPGYHSQTLNLNTTLEPIFYLNVFIVGVLGSTTDFATGSMWQVSPNTYNVDLHRSVGK